MGSDERCERMAYLLRAETILAAAEATLDRIAGQDAQAERSRKWAVLKRRAKRVLDRTQARVPDRTPGRGLLYREHPGKDFYPLPRYDPNQPRDEDGKWTDGGGDGGGGAAAGLGNVTISDHSRRPCLSGQTGVDQGCAV
jgi:hypothetical protein